MSVEKLQEMPDLQRERGDVEQVENISEEDQINARKQLERPMTVTEHEDGETEMSADNIKITMNHSPLSRGEADELAHFRGGHDRSNGLDSHGVSMQNLPNAQAWRKMDRFVVNSGTEQKDLTKIMPDFSQYDIFFCPELPQDKHSSSLDEENKNIYIVGNMTSLMDVVELLYQIGHIWHGGGHVEDAAQDESGAANFTMQLLKPFMAGEDSENIKNVVQGGFHEENV